MIGAVLLSAIAMFAVGGVWYSVLFGKQWGQIHGFDKLDKAAQQKLQREVGPLYLVQAIVTVLSAVVLVTVVKAVPSVSPYLLAFWIWCGFVMPAQVSSVLFSNTQRHWMVTKTFIMTGETLVHLEVAAAIVSWITK